jgi:hypothetical protein
VGVAFQSPPQWVRARTDHPRSGGLWSHPSVNRVGNGYALLFCIIVRWRVGERAHPFTVTGVLIAIEMVAMGLLGDLAARFVPPWCWSAICPVQRLC